MISLIQKKEEQKPAPQHSQDIYERCVLCGVMTDIPRSVHSDLRYGSVEGAGQLCRKCYQELYGR